MNDDKQALIERSSLYAGITIETMIIIHCNMSGKLVFLPTTGIKSGMRERLVEASG